MTDLDDLPEPDPPAEEIMGNLRSALTTFETVLIKQAHESILRTKTRSLCL